MFSNKTKANLALFSGGILFGVSSPLARMIGAWLNPFSVVLVRFVFALPFALGLFLKGEKRSFPVKKLWLFGLLFPVSVCFYIFALFHTKVSLAIFSNCIANLLASIVLGTILNKEKLSPYKLCGFMCAFAAVICFTHPTTGFLIDKGMIFGYLCGITQTVASLYQKRLSDDVDERALTLAQVIGGIVIAVIALLVMQDKTLLTINMNGLVLGAVYGFLFFLINYFMIYGFKYAEIGIGTILLSGELIFGPLAAYAVFGEIMSGMEWIGGGLIIIAVILVSKHKDPSSSQLPPIILD